MHPSQIHDILEAPDGINSQLAHLEFELVTNHKCCAWRKHMVKVLSAKQNRLYDQLIHTYEAREDALSNQS